MKIERILCPTDFSENAAHAVEQTAMLARYYKAKVTALHVFSPLQPTIETSTPETLRCDVHAFFEPVRRAGIVTEVVVDVGAAVKHILSQAASLPADLIVMGTHGASGFEHLVLGSVTEKVLRRAMCPVLTVPPRAHSTSRLPFQRLLCGVDFSDASLDAVKSALSLAEESGAQLMLVHVLEWPWEEPPAPRLEDIAAEQGRALSEFRRYAEVSARKRLASVVPAQTTARVATRVESGKPYLQLLDVAAQEQSDLIVIGVRGRNPVDLTVFGSTANHVVRRASCPVLTLR